MIRTIGTFSEGPRLSELERTCVASWRRHGYGVDIFSFAPVANTPDGCALRDASEVIDRRILLDGAPELNLRKLTPIRTDIFRMAMLRKGGRIWCNSGFLMLRPFPPFRSMLAGRDPSGKLRLDVLWLAQDHPVLEAVIRAFRTRSLPPWTEHKWRVRSALHQAWTRRRSLQAYPEDHWAGRPLNFYIKGAAEWTEALAPSAFYHPATDDPALFANAPFDHLLEDAAIYGLVFSKRHFKRFGRAEAGSFVDWAWSRFGLGLS